MSHAKAKAGPGPAEVLGARPENIDGVDFSKYFSAYGYLYNQKVRQSIHAPTFLLLFFILYFLHLLCCDVRRRCWKTPTE